MGPSTSSPNWRNAAQLVDARDTVHAIAFAPRHMGLRIATASADGFVRMYEAIDVLNLSHWPLQEEFLGHVNGVTCLAWNPSILDVPMVVLGADKNATVWAYHTSLHRWQTVTSLVGHSESVLDVSWAPQLGRSYHVIATASKDHTLRIWKLKWSTTDNVPTITVETICIGKHDGAEVWRVEWNVTGTMLTSSGDDGSVRMWKRDFEGTWICVNTIVGQVPTDAP